MMALHETMIDQVLAGFDTDIYKRKDGELAGLNLHFFAKLAACHLPVKFVPEVNGFYLFDSSTTTCAPANSTKMAKLLKDMLFEYGARQEIAGIDKLVSTSTLSELQTLLRMEVEEQGFFDRSNRSAPVIHAENGFLRPESDNSCWQLAEKDEAVERELHSCHRLQVAFDPSAECPEFMRFLQDGGLSEEDQFVLQSYLGQAQLGRNRDNSILLVNGDGGNCHRQLLTLIRRIIGEGGIAFLPHGSFGVRKIYQEILGRHLAMASEVPPEYLITCGSETVLSLTGNDPIRLETRGGNENFYIEGEYPVILFSNQRLRLSLQGDKEAWRRRLLSISFAQTDHGKENQESCQQTVELLQQEQSGILNWMLAGALEVLKNNGLIPRSKEQIRAIDDILEEADSVQVFCTEILTKADSSDTVTCLDLQTAYVSYCLGRHWTPLAKHQAGGLLQQTLFRLFRIPQATDITRDGTSKRGYRRLKIQDNVNTNNK